jgi:hypothetical protein
MRVIIALLVLAVSLSLVGCSCPNQAAYAKPLPSPPPPHTPKVPTKAVAEQSRQAGEVSAKGSRANVNKVKAAVVATPENYGISKHIVERVPAKAEPKLAVEARPKPPAAGGALPTTIDTVGGVANALTLGESDQAVRTAKAYTDNLKANVSLFYRDLATDRLPSEQTEAAINLVHTISLFDRPEQGIANLKVLRQGIEKELAIDETDAIDNKLAEARQKSNERVFNARRLIGMIGTDEGLDRALVYLNTLQTEPQWAEFVKMLASVTEQEAEAKFKAAEAKAKKLGGPQKLTREDIDGLSSEQIKQLRGY